MNDSLELLHLSHIQNVLVRASKGCGGTCSYQPYQAAVLPGTLLVIFMHV